jgi:hypothetical protein
MWEEEEDEEEEEGVDIIPCIFKIANRWRWVGRLMSRYFHL